MSAYLQKISGIAFYILGSSFLIAWILLQNKLWMRESAVFLQTVDLPLIGSGILYGGLSLYGSLCSPGRPSKTLPWMIGVPLAALFGMALTMNFWS